MNGDCSGGGEKRLSSPVIGYAALRGKAA